MSTERDPAGSTATALVVDDEPHILRAVRNALAPEFGRVLAAESAAQGVDLAAAHRPDLIVLDLGLPDRPGEWVCVELRKWSVAPMLMVKSLVDVSGPRRWARPDG